MVVAVADSADRVAVAQALAVRAVAVRAVAVRAVAEDSVVRAVVVPVVVETLAAANDGDHPSKTRSIFGRTLEF